MIFLALYILTPLDMFHNICLMYNIIKSPYKHHEYPLSLQEPHHIYNYPYISRCPIEKKSAWGEMDPSSSLDVRFSLILNMSVCGHLLYEVVDVHLC